MFFERVGKQEEEILQKPGSNPRIFLKQKTCCRKDRWVALSLMNDYE